MRTPDDVQLLAIRRADTELILSPAIGGSVVSFRVAGADILRSGSPAAIEGRNPLGLAAFPLFPFSGRIANARFGHGGREIMLHPNFPPEPHAIHGQAWRKVWRVTECGEDTARLVFEHDGRDWPWAYRAEQRFSVAKHAFALSLSLTNMAPASMPAGMGWHPYFPREDARLSADVTMI
jgi:aldose 1-epimerase